LTGVYRFLSKEAAGEADKAHLRRPYFITLSVGLYAGHSASAIAETLLLFALAVLVG
jgi:hypothetical protein